MKSDITYTIDILIYCFVLLNKLLNCEIHVQCDKLLCHGPVDCGVMIVDPLFYMKILGLILPLRLILKTRTSFLNGR